MGSGNVGEEMRKGGVDERERVEAVEGESDKSKMAGKVQYFLVRQGSYWEL